MANPLTVYVLAAVAEHDDIPTHWGCARGRQGSGKRLGNPDGARALRAAGAGQAGWTAGAAGNREGIRAAERL
jgi:hypothetical protein